jgi:hypothetical protein
MSERELQLYVVAASAGCVILLALGIIDLVQGWHGGVIWSIIYFGGSICGAVGAWSLLRMRDALVEPRNEERPH